MPEREEPNTYSESTRWRYTRVRIKRAPEATEHSRPKGVRWRRFGKRDPRQPIQVTLKWRGGPEAWIEVTGRGETNRYPGFVSIAEIVLDINQAH